MHQSKKVVRASCIVNHGLLRSCEETEDEETRRILSTLSMTVQEFVAKHRASGFVPYEIDISIASRESEPGLSEPSREPVAWLIENRNKHEWLVALRSEPNSFIDPSYNVAIPVMTSDANAAIRFPDKASADSVIKSLHLQGYFASEHVFLYAHPLSAVPEKPADEATP